MKKLLSLCLVLLLIISVSACAPNEAPPEEAPPADEEPIGETPADEEPDQEEPTDEEPDAATTPSIVADEDSFKNAISENGTWIIAILNDLTINEDLVIEGEFRDKDDPENDLYRKVALYAQDEDRKVTEEYTLTVSKLTVKSPNTRIQHGRFVGDIYVEADGFNIVDTDVEGNIYFASKEYQSSFTNDEGTISGSTEVQE